jgi:hypothetical protein
VNSAAIPAVMETPKTEDVKFVIQKALTLLNRIEDNDLRTGLCHRGSKLLRDEDGNKTHETDFVAETC